MTGRLLAAFLVLLLSCWPSFAIETADPVSMSREIFALYGKDGSGFDLNGSEAARVLAPELLALLRGDRKAGAGEVGTLDFDPFCGCQDFDITSVKAARTRSEGQKAQVSVAFRNFGKAETTLVSLVRTEGGWRVSDLRQKRGQSLVALLRRAGR